VPSIRDLLQKAGWPASTINLVGVSVGPGSFTGLRIGVTTAKTFAYAVGADVLGISTIEVLAAPISAGVRLWTILDAQRGDLFASLFTRSVETDWQTTGPTHIINRDQWLQKLQAGDLVTGPILDRIADHLPVGVNTADGSLQTPSAEWVARVAWKSYQIGRRDDLFQLVPQYHRASAAEEKLS
jgi:tRNA threonylcarbamoyladenosine biosynthesis protein TsaB